MRRRARCGSWRRSPARSSGGRWTGCRRFPAVRGCRTWSGGKGPAPRGSGQSVVKYLDQVAEISGLGLAGLGVETLVPPRRLAELARYG